MGKKPSKRAGGGRKGLGGIPDPFSIPRGVLLSSLAALFDCGSCFEKWPQKEVGGTPNPPPWIEGGPTATPPRTFLPIKPRSALTPPFSTSPDDLKLSDFDIGKRMGHGKYGSVYLARGRDPLAVLQVLCNHGCPSPITEQWPPTSQRSLCKMDIKSENGD